MYSWCSFPRSNKPNKPNKPNNTPNTLFPFPSLPRYLAFVALADVVFEPFPFSSGVSSFEIFSVGVPVVIFPTAAPWIMQVRQTGEVGRTGEVQEGRRGAGLEDVQNRSIHLPLCIIGCVVKWTKCLRPLVQWHGNLTPPPQHYNPSFFIYSPPSSSSFSSSSLPRSLPPFHF